MDKEQVKARAEEFRPFTDRIAELEADLKLNASMLARQCDLARDAETRVKELEVAWFIDEAIQKDGSLRPSISDTVRRAEKAEASNKKLRELIKEHKSDTQIYLSNWHPFEPPRQRREWDEKLWKKALEE